MKVVALLPMKAHSERIPNKNMRLFGGRPLYHCVAQILECSSFVNRIVIDTDSDAIAQDALNHFPKVQINERPVELRGDFVSTNKVLAHDIELSEGEHFLQTHCTNPLLTKETLERAIQDYFAMPPDYDSLFSVTRIQTRLYWESGEPVNHNPQELLRTQDLPPLFEENSNMYVFSRTSFQTASKNRIGLKPKMFVMDKAEAVDIDEEEDWQLAEALYELRENMK